MPYKDSERKRQWEKQHREQRNAMRRKRRLGVRSGQPIVPGTTSDIASALCTQGRKRPDPSSYQKPEGGWKSALGWAVYVGLVTLHVCRHFHPAGIFWGFQCDLQEDIKSALRSDEVI